MGRFESPLQGHYPTICEWVEGGAVNTDRLRDELEKALAWVESGATHPEEFTLSMDDLVNLRHSAFLRSRMLSEARASVALDKGDGQTISLEGGAHTAKPRAKPCTNPNGHLRYELAGACVDCGR